MDAMFIPVGVIAIMALSIVVFFRSRFTTVAVCALLIFAAGASVACYGSSADFLTCVSPWDILVLIGFCSTFYVGVLQDDKKRSRARGAAFEERWREACHVLDEGHEHAGGLIRGTYEGYPLEARASYIDLAPQASSVSVYEISVRSEPGGRRWSARPNKLWRSWKTRKWVIVGRPKDVKTTLAEAGIVELLQAEQELGVGRNPKISYDPANGTLRYGDASGSVPDADTFRLQIKTLIRLVAINSEHNLGRGT